jgi:hypothetical protein
MLIELFPVGPRSLPPPMSRAAPLPGRPSPRGPPAAPRLHRLLRRSEFCPHCGRRQAQVLFGNRRCPAAGSVLTRRPFWPRAHGALRRPSSRKTKRAGGARPWDAPTLSRSPPCAASVTHQASPRPHQPQGHCTDHAVSSHEGCAACGCYCSI